MSSVFISCRRADSSRWANRLVDHLNMRFGKDLVFQNVEDVRPGEDFPQDIRRAMPGCRLQRLERQTS
jgi:hypothetical protein